MRQPAYVMALDSAQDAADNAQETRGSVRLACFRKRNGISRLEQAGQTFIAGKQRRAVMIYTYIFTSYHFVIVL